MDILILANYDYGLYIFRKELLEKIVKDNNVFVSVPKGEYKNKLEELGCKVIETELSRRGTNPIADLKLFNSYKKIIKDIKPNIVLTYTIKPNVYGGMACQIYKVPYVANITGLGSALENKGILQVISSNLYRMGLKKAQKVFFQNESNRDFMLNHNIVKDNYDLIPGSGVNLDKFKFMEYKDSQTIDFVYVGRLMKQKGLDQYLDAAKYIRNKYPNTRFHICGFCEDDYKEVIDNLVKDEVVIYHGVIEDMKKIYEITHCTILPTYYPEGMSNVLLESLACGRPIITTNRPGTKEIVEDKINGFVVKEKDSQDLIEKIEMFISLSFKQREQLGINGRKKVEKYFDRNIVVNKYLKEIEKCQNQ